MTRVLTIVRSRTVASALALALLSPLALVGCASGGGPKMPPPGSAQPDKFLFDRGTDAASKKHWIEAREYFRTLVERYPQSVYRPDAKLAIGDTYIGENSAESKVLAVNEFQEFLSYFPTNSRADYAQFRMGYAHFKQMLGAQRDQTETREAVQQFGLFLQRYPNSPLKAEVMKYDRQAKDRLSESEYEVGRFYARMKWCPGAVGRLEGVVKADPEFTNRDGVYYYLGECYFDSNQKPAALPWFERLVKEFQQSEYLDKAKKRVAELKSAPSPK